MFGTVNPTPFDFEFRAFGIPVYVSVWFWVTAALLGYPLFAAGVPFILTWMLVVFISILIHELGHALTARLFGYHPRILLQSFGGLASYDNYGRPPSLGRSILITLAGPMAGFGVFALLLIANLTYMPSLIDRLPEEFQPVAELANSQLLVVNLIWGVINLLPVLPLDGGQIARDIFTIFSPYNGFWYAVRTSVIVAGAAAIFFYVSHSPFAAIMFAILCANNISTLQQRGSW